MIVCILSEVGKVAKIERKRVLVNKVCLGLSPAGGGRGWKFKPLCIHVELSGWENY
jgi:hypothetical protein